MRRFWRPAALAMLVLAVCAARSSAQDAPRYFEKDGVTYRETRQVVRRPVVETHMEARECTVYRDKFTTEVQETPRSIPVAITEYHWVPVWHRPWNPWGAPYLTYQMQPQTRWETRNDTVKTSVVRRQTVPEKITQQVPVTSQRFVEDQIVTTVAVGTWPTGINAPGAIVAGPAGGAPAPDPTAGNRYSPPPPSNPVAAGRYGAPAVDPASGGRYGQPNPYAQPNGFAQPNSYGQPNAYGQPNTLPPAATTPEVANRTAIGGVKKLDGDPPLGSSGWRAGDDSIRR